MADSIDSSASHPEGERARLFLAVPLPEPTVAALGGLLDRLRKGAMFTPCRPVWARPESIHLTLVFLGSTPVEKIGMVSAAARTVAAACSPLRIEVKRLGVFPNWKSPRVLWAGTRERTHQLGALHDRLAEACVRLGFEREAREFHPHLTLARIKSLTGVDALRKVVEAHQEIRLPAFDAPELVLFRSRLEPGGAVHTALEKFPFTAPAAIGPAAQEAHDET